MALPIGVTPVLGGKEATEFLSQVQREVGNKVGPIPTPRLEMALRLIRQYGSKDNGNSD